MSGKNWVLVLYLLLKFDVLRGGGVGEIMELLSVSFSSSLYGKLDSQPLSLHSWGFNHDDLKTVGINE